MVSFLGRRMRNSLVIVGIIVIVLVNVGMQYSSTVSEVVRPPPPTTITNTTNGWIRIDEMVVDEDRYTRYNSSTIMEEEEMGEEDDDDDDDKVIDAATNHTLLRGKDTTPSIISNAHIIGTLLEDKNASSMPLPACLRARNDTIPRSMYGKMPFPVINLGFTKVGSTSIHSFFGNAGYTSKHLVCGRTDGNRRHHDCAQCIADSIEQGLPPLQLCRKADAYSQIDGTANKTLYFPQIDLLEELVSGQPNATFLLPFRSMDGWYQSVSRWGTLWRRMVHVNLTIGETSLGAGSQEEFTNFFCEHVRRVREIVPANRLVEIDIEDHSTGARLSDIFDIDEECWGRTNVNGKLHPEIDKNLNPGWTIEGKEVIRGKNGTMRTNSNYIMKMEEEMGEEDDDDEEGEEDDDDEEWEEDDDDYVTEAAINETTSMKSYASSHIAEHVTIEVEDEDALVPDCLRARNDIYPRSKYGNFTLPVINLGFPKVGSTAIHAFFGSAGYKSLHWQCPKTKSEKPKTLCAKCIQESIQAGLLPLELCPRADVYAEIDGTIDGMHQLPQIDLLENLVDGYPTATFLLTFRSMNAWYESVSNWPRKRKDLKERLVATNSTGGKDLGEGSLQNFTNFFCHHVRRVREIVPANRLVEFDIEDPSTGARLSEIFNVKQELWGKTNVNTMLHPEATTQKTTTKKKKMKK